jgi:hypothetical protein
VHIVGRRESHDDPNDPKDDRPTSREISTPESRRPTFRISRARGETSEPKLSPDGFALVPMRFANVPFSPSRPNRCVDV